MVNTGIGRVATQPGALAGGAHWAIVERYWQSYLYGPVRWRGARTGQP